MTDFTDSLASDKATASIKGAGYATANSVGHFPDDVIDKIEAMPAKDTKVDGLIERHHNLSSLNAKVTGNDKKS